MLSAPSEEMTGLLKSVLINSDNGSIKWEKLEQFISIAGNADAAMTGDFQALKKAQDRSDIIKLYSKKQVQQNMTYDVTIQIFDFLISENGKFLFDPLINEIVETIEALGLSAQAVSSILTSGLIPAPTEKPDRKKVELFFKLMTTILNRADGSTGSSSSTLQTDSESKKQNIIDDGENLSSGDIENNRNTGLIPTFQNNNQQRMNVLRIAFNFINNLLQLPQERFVQIQPIINRSSVLIRAVISKLAERSVRRVVRSVINPKSVSESFPTITRIADFVFPLINSQKQRQK